MRRCLRIAGNACRLIGSSTEVGDLIIGPNTIVIDDSIGEPGVEEKAGGYIGYIVGGTRGEAGGNAAVDPIAYDIRGSAGGPANIEGISRGDHGNNHTCHFFRWGGILRRAAGLIGGRAKVGYLIIGSNFIIVGHPIGEPDIEEEAGGHISHIVGGSGGEAR